jgi:protein SCO1/2
MTRLAPRLPALALLCALAWAPAPAAGITPPDFQKVKVVEKLGDHVPEQLTFTGADGKPFQLADAFHHDKPVILTLVYYDCPSLCRPMMEGLTDALAQSGLKLGKDYDGVTVSFDPTETPAVAQKEKDRLMKRLGAADGAAHWIFGTSTDPAIHKLADAVGFGYTYVGSSKQYAHDAVVFVLSPDAKLMRYLYGINFVPQDVKFALIEASHNRVGTTLDHLVLRCFQFDPSTHRYSLYAVTFVKAGAVLVLITLATLLTILWRQEVKKRGAET